MEELTPVISSSSSSSFYSRWTYDVFLSFRGEDTRYGFTGNLYHALADRGIHTFIDNRLKRGEEITRALFKTIEESRIAVIIFSVNYASSTFCLEELVKILECKEPNRGLVWPIFYKVDPSDVRHLRGSYGEAIAGHETKFKNTGKLQRWKWALHRAANLSGWHFEEGDGYEYEFVEKIVEEVSNRINPMHLQGANYPVGLKSRVEVLISLLHLKSNKVISVGIHGIGGVGKTTIAYEVYNAIVDQFECVCFLSNVRERSKKLGLIKLQESLLFELTRKRITISNVTKGIPIIKRRLCQKKVLLILDDVCSQEQLGALAGGVDWFGMGSRIIITTRNKHLLDVYGVSGNYEVEELCFEEALELFSWNAFKKSKVDPRYASILECVTRYCNGLPLALEIIGSNLFNKTQEEWESALETYKNIPAKNIQSILKASYDDLEEIEKEIFLDIACFFNGYDLDVVKSILLNGHGYDPQYGIGVLVTKSLIKIDQRQVKIHDLIAQMGKEIIRRQSPSNPENWNRMWSYKHILDVLQENKGTDRIQALVLKRPQNKKVWWDGNAFKKMTNLKILIIGSAQFSCGPKYLPNSLRVLEWKNYSLSTLPSHYDPRNLAILNLCKSSFKLTKPLKNFESLTELVLEDCRFLKHVPDISRALSLKIINVRNCRNLVEVHDSVGFLNKLVLLNVDGCSNLRVLPISIKSAFFQILDLSGCFRLRSVPEMFGVVENNLATPNFNSYGVAAVPGCLHFRKRHYLRQDLQLCCGIWMLPKLENWMDGLQHFNKCSGDDQKKVSPALPVSLCIFGPSTFFEFRRESHFPPTILDLDWNNLTDKCFSTWRPYYYSFTMLSLQSCNLTDEFLHQRLPWFPNLITLMLAYNKFTILPECMNECHYLKKLTLTGCKGLQEVKGIPPNIKSLSLGDCISLTSQPLRKLLSQSFHEDGGREVVVPGYRIPKWLDHRCAESSISFWFLGEFPRLALWLVRVFPKLKIRMFINGIEVLGSTDPLLNVYVWGSDVPSIEAYDVHEGVKKSKIVLREGEWNHVLLLDDRQSTHAMGVHVYKKEKGADNVRFINPNPLNRTFTINHKLNLNASLSLSKKFCPLLGMQVSDAATNSQEREEFYRFMREYEYPSCPIWKAITVMEAPTKVKALIWKFSIKYPRDLPTCCYLFSRRLLKCPMCLICGTEYETIVHVFFECPWTQPLWFASDFAWIMNDKWLLTYGICSWLRPKLDHIMKLHPNARSVIGLMGNICWVIWTARNEFILKDKPVNPLEALMTAKAMHMQYSSEASTSTIHSVLENKVNRRRKGTSNNNAKKEANSDKGTQVENKTKRKRKGVSNDSEIESDNCEKDTQVENKAKRKKGGESNGNTKREPNCDKGTQIEDKGNQRRKRANNKIDNKVNRRRKGVCNNNTQREVNNDEGTQVENTGKGKRKGVGNNPEIEPYSDKGTKVENKAKWKKGGLSNSSTKREPNCDKGSAIPIDISSMTRDEDNIATMVGEIQKQHEEVNQMLPNEKEDEQPTKKRKYQRKSQSDMASNKPTEPSSTNISSNDSQIEHETRTKQPNTTTKPIPLDHLNQNIIEKSQEQVASKEISINEAMLESEPQITISEMNKEAEVEVPSDFDSSQGNIEVKKLEVQQLKHSKAMSEDEEDPIAALTYLILADEEISSSNNSKSETTFRPDAEHRAKIKKAILALNSILEDDLEMFLKDHEKRESLKSILETLQDTTEDDVNVDFKSFVLQLGQQFPSMLECMDEASTIEETFQSLASRKKELVAFSKSTGTRKQQLDKDRQVCMQKVKTNSQQILATKAKIVELEKELEQLKATQLNLEGVVKAIDLEDQMLKQQAKNAINDFKATLGMMESMEVERKTMNVAKAQTLFKWKDLKGTFKKMVDYL